MATEGWVDEKSRYVAHGEVYNGRMSNATVSDNNGFTLGYDYSFDSKQDFYSWARKRAGISW